MIAVTNRALCHQDFLQQLYKLANAQVAAIILREKDLSAEAYLQLAYQKSASIAAYRSSIDFEWTYRSGSAVRD